MVILKISFKYRTSFKNIIFIYKYYFNFSKSVFYGTVQVLLTIITDFNVKIPNFGKEPFFRDLKVFS